MRTGIIILSLFLGLNSCVSTQEDEKKDFVQYVDPFIGTAHCRWFHFTPGALPFGLAKPAPSTNGSLGNASGWEATGYDFRDNTIEGFTCLHEFQIGGITLMPTSGKLITVPGLPSDTVKLGYRSSFSRKNEIATAGYYSVLLDDYQIKAELTSTNRVAFQRFTFSSDDDNHILFNIGNRQGESGKVKDSYVVFTDDNRIEGWVITEPEYVKKYQPGATVSMFFSAELDKKPDSYGSYNGEKIEPGKTESIGTGAGMYLTFNDLSDKSVTAKIGLSYTSIENARLNLASEAENLTFDDARAAANDVWNDYLGRIEVETDKKDDKIKFYTGLYHALLGRGMANDANGDYPRNDGSVCKLPLKDGKPLYNIYNTDAAWGAQWNLSQLWSLAYPEHMSEYVSTHLQAYKDAGWLADGLANNRYVSGVGTNLLSTIIAGAYQCGIRDFDTDVAYKACLKNELDGENRPFGAGKVNTAEFVKYGYVPHRDNGEGHHETFMFSASHTLEYSYSAWAVAQWAREIGDMDNYNKLIDLSKGWERLYDTSCNFIRPKKADGHFIENFDPMQVWRGFQEGNAWQYTFYVPHDVNTLVSKVGEDLFNSRLDSIFTISKDKIFSGGTEIGAFAGLKTLYNHGNQPCLHISWLFNEAGRPDLTQKWVKEILNVFYGTDGIHGYGYGQDEDQGQLGAWYVISSIGLFDVKGLTDSEPSFALGAPLFDKVTIHLNKKYYPGDKFVVTTSNNFDGNTYVQQYKLNGNVVHGTRIPFKEIVKGGNLDVELGVMPKVKY